jgi:penicillin-binding protein 1C
MLAAPLAALWFATDWSAEGSGEYPGGVVLRDSAGSLMRVSLGPGDVDCRPYYEADPDDWIVKALVASEDGTFWTHCGVRPLSVVRAAFQNVVCRRRVSGASTISMQAVRLIRPHPKTFLWKAREAVMAVKMERVRDKRWILSQYLNRAPFGSNLVGIEAAASGWFGKSAKTLGLGEAAMLAGMVQAPSRFRPDRRYERAIKRRDYVLGRMLELGMVDEAQVEAAKSVRPVVCRAPRPFRAPHYCDWAMQALAGEGRAGCDVRTPLDADIQKIAENAVESASSSRGCSSAAVVVRASTGDVVALACSGDYFGGDSGQVNTALAPRPAGSTLKPFLAAMAIDRGIAMPSTLVADLPVAVKGYRPENFDSKYRGLVPLKDALVLSLNLPFVRLLRRVGVQEFGDCLRLLGFSHMDSPDESFGLGMAIGNVEVSLMELVQAYRMVASGGYGVFSPGSAYLVSDMLSGSQRSAAALGHVADVAAPRFAWKTGTSSAYRDAWTVAWNPEWVVGVWCGHMSGGFGDTTVVGAKAAAPVAWSIARSLYPQGGGPWYAEPDDAARLRGDGGRLVARMEEGDVGLRLSCPEDGAVFSLVPGMGQQKIVCRAVGCAEAERLWWFVDGVPAGDGASSSPFAVDMSAGSHVVSCTTASGDAASARLTVR